MNRSGIPGMWMIFLGGIPLLIPYGTDRESKQPLGFGLRGAGMPRREGALSDIQGPCQAFFAGLWKVRTPRKPPQSGSSGLAATWLLRATKVTGLVGACGSLAAAYR